MAKVFNLEVITPSERFYKGDVELVTVTTLDGVEGFMANHAWACKLLGIGEMRIKEQESKGRVFSNRMAVLTEGYIDVKDKIIIYTDNAEWVEDINLEEAQKRYEKALENLENASDDLTEKESNDLVYFVEVAKARLKLAQKYESK